jgi:hypothetical protein
VRDSLHAESISLPTMVHDGDMFEVPLNTCSLRMGMLLVESRSQAQNRGFEHELVQEGRSIS